MGLSEGWLLVEGQDPDLPASVLEGRELEAMRSTFGWACFSIKETWRSAAEIGSFVSGVSRSVNAPALLAFVEDSDYALLVFAGDGDSGCLVVNPKDAGEYSIGSEALSAAGAKPQENQEGLAAWSSRAPAKATPKQIAKIMKKRWTFAEDALDELLELLGLPIPPEKVDSRFGEAVFLVDDPEMNKSRYVIGWGDGFAAVWDRQNPASPMVRFPDDEKGRLAVCEEWGRLDAAPKDDESTAP